jgi:hypothetical protein
MPSPQVACRTAALLFAVAAPSARAQSGPVLEPGSHLLAKLAFRDARTEYHYLMRVPGADTAEHERYAQVVETRKVPGHSDQLMQIKSITTPGTVFADTITFVRDGLAPIREAMHSGKKWLDADYAGATLQIVKQSADSAVVRHPSTFPHRVFGFNQLDDVVRSVPLRDNFSAIVPLFSEGDDALEMDTIRVTGRGKETGTWMLRFADPAIVSTYTVNERTREITGYEIDPRRGGHIRRVTGG